MSQPAGRLTAGSLIVDFRSQADRVGHALLATDGQREVLLAETLEGNGEQDWPPSPPLQQLSLETTADGRPCALLVGMAGISHWSASVEFMAGVIRFELACRAKQLPELLASTYRAGEGTLEVGRSIVLRTVGGRLVMRPAANTSLRADGNQWSMAADSLPATVPNTVCWGYEIEFNRQP